MNRIMLASALMLGVVGCGGGSGSSTETAGGTTSSGGEMHHSNSEMHDGQAATTETTAAVVAPGQATIGDTTTCPVTGETFVVTADSTHVEHDGLTYYFCCAGCDARFQANPHQYLSEHPSS